MLIVAVLFLEVVYHEDIICTRFREESLNPVVTISREKEEQE